MQSTVTPAPILNILTDLWRSQTLYAGVKLRLFTLIEEGENNSEKLASAAGLPESSTEKLANALVALGLVTKRGAEYFNTDVSSEFLVEGKMKYYGDFVIMNSERTYDTWGTLVECARADSPQRDGIVAKFRQDEDFARLFTRAMHNNAIAPARALVSTIDFSRSKVVLDLGGGSGAYSILLAKANPQIEAIVFDLPPVCDVADEYIQRLQLADRIKTSRGDFLVDALPSPVDDVILAQILHSYPPSDCITILTRAAACLTDGGRLLIMDFFLQNDKVSPEYCALFSLNMLVGSPGGTAYSLSETESMLAAAGCSVGAVVEIPGPSSLVIAEKL